MVNTIDIQKLNLEELSGVVGLYPWFAQARVELCARLGKAGACSGAQLTSSALYVPSRKKLYSKTRGTGRTDCSDADIEKLIQTYIAPREAEPAQPRVIVAGADFFSMDQYRSVAGGQENIKFCPVGDSKDNPVSFQNTDGQPDIYTETLAKIYLEQGYLEEAKNIYSKLILRYPEKSVYFAALIEKIDNL